MKEADEHAGMVQMFGGEWVTPEEAERRYIESQTDPHRFCDTKGEPGYHPGAGGGK